MIYVIEANEGGDVTVKSMSEEEFKIAVNKAPDSFEYSDIRPIDPTQLRDNTMIINPIHWNDTSGLVLAIRGELVKVVPIKKVDSWEVK